MSYGGQGTDPHLASTKKKIKPSRFVDDSVTDLNVVSTQVNYDDEYIFQTSSNHSTRWKACVVSYDYWHDKLHIVNQCHVVDEYDCYC